METLRKSLNQALSQRALKVEKQSRLELREDEDHSQTEDFYTNGESQRRIDRAKVSPYITGISSSQSRRPNIRNADASGGTGGGVTLIANSRNVKVVGSY